MNDYIVIELVPDHFPDNNMRARYSNILLHIALVAFIATQAIVPAGFMPSALTEGHGFSYCPGDISNKLIVQALEQKGAHAHHHHNHPSADDALTKESQKTASTTAEDHCQFSLASTPATSTSTDIPPLFHVARLFHRSAIPTVAHRSDFFVPHTRAPPA